MTTLCAHPAWTAQSRGAVFLLASTSIACLLADLSGMCPMRLFTPFIFLPAFIALLIYVFLDRGRGSGAAWRAVWIGIAGGLLAALAYDLFRAPFVYARQLGIESVVPAMDLFKVFPRFGAMILGEPIEQARYSTAAQALGWLYHFSNGATFGIMYVALAGEPARRHWAWAILFALVLEAGMLSTPYPARFNIPISPRFVAVTLAAHAVFGVVLGLSVRAVARSLPRGEAVMARVSRR